MAVVIDDAKLLELASGRPGELCTTLKRGASLKPLVALLAILPALFALEHHVLTAAGAAWGLKSLDLLAASEIGTVIYGGEAVSEPLRYRSPLASWLTAAVMSRVPPSHATTLLVLPFLATAGTVAMFYLLCWRLVDSRCAFWATLLLAVHGPLLAQAQTPVPVAPAVLLAVVTFWGVVAHLQEPEGAVSVRLLAAGCALGLCTLADGRAAVGVASVLLLFALIVRGDSGRRQAAGRESRRRLRGGWAAMKALGVVGLTAFAVAGWWPLMMSAEFGSGFWLGWLSGGPGPAAASAVPGGGWPGGSPAWTTLQALVDLLGVLAVFALFGAGLACRELVATRDYRRRRAIQFLLTWCLAGLVLWWPSLWEPGAVAGLWAIFLLLPAVALAALAIDEICARRVGPLAAVGMTWTALVVPLLMPLVSTAAEQDAAETTLTAAAGLTLAFVGITAWLLTAARGHDRARRVTLTLLLLAVALVNGWRGFAAVRPSRAERADSRALHVFRESLQSAVPREANLLIQEPGAPPLLEYVVQAAQPHVALKTAESWNEAIAKALSAVREGETSGEALVVEWRAAGERRPPGPAGSTRLRAVGPARIYRGRRLRAYVLSLRNAPAD